MEFAAIALVLRKVLTVAMVLFVTKTLFPTATEESFFLLIWAGTIGAALTFLLTLVWTGMSFPVRFRFEKTLSKELLIEAAPFAIALALNTLYVRLDILLLSLLLPSSEGGICSSPFCGDVEVGAYAVATNFRNSSHDSHLFHEFCSPQFDGTNSKKSDTLLRLLQNAFSFLLAVGAPANSSFSLGRETTSLISSDAFLSTLEQAGSDSALRILSGMIPVAFLSIFFWISSHRFRATKELIRINFLTVSCNILLDLFLIPKYGFIGARMGIVFSEFVLLSLMIFTTNRSISFTPDIRLLKILASAGGAGAIAFGAHAICISFGTMFSFGGTFIVFTGIYALNLWITGVLSKQMMREVFGKTPS